MENTGDSLQTIMRVYNNPSPEDMRINALDIGRDLWREEISQKKNTMFDTTVTKIFTVR